MSEEKNWEWAVEDRPHGTFLLSNGGYPIAMISSAGPGHIIDTAAKIAEALNAHERRASPTPEGQGGGADARRSSEWLRAYAQSSFTTIEEADRLHTAANELDRLARLLSSPREEDVRREERERVAKALARANDRMPSIEVPAAGGDNLAVVLCSFFCDGEPSEDDHGWSPAAIEGEEQMIAAIRKHYVDALSPPVKDTK